MVRLPVLVNGERLFSQNFHFGTPGWPTLYTRIVLASELFLTLSSRAQRPQVGRWLRITNMWTAVLSPGIRRQESIAGIGHAGRARPEPRSRGPRRAPGLRSLGWRRGRFGVSLGR